MSGSLLRGSSSRAPDERDPPGGTARGQKPAYIPAYAGVRPYLAPGTLEPGFRRSTREWAERLGRAGLPCRHEEWTGGHDQVWWEQQLPVALGWLVGLPASAFCAF